MGFSLRSGGAQAPKGGQRFQPSSSLHQPPHQRFNHSQRTSVSADSLEGLSSLQLYRGEITALLASHETT